MTVRPRPYYARSAAGGAFEDLLVLLLTAVLAVAAFLLAIAIETARWAAETYADWRGRGRERDAPS